MSEDPIRFRLDYPGGTNSKPQSEVYREAYEAWIAADAKARLLEECKSVTFAQHVTGLRSEFPGLSVAMAETKIKASDVWEQYIRKMVEARTDANRARVALEVARMKHWEQAQDRADHRYEARMS
jgi:hypothetical protein